MGMIGCILKHESSLWVWVKQASTCRILLYNINSTSYKNIHRSKNRPDQTNVMPWPSLQRGRRLTCWSWPGSASPWRWAWACERCVRRGTPAWGWRGTGTWWPGTWSEGTGRSWWGCQQGPPCPARHTWLSTRRKLPSAPVGRCWKSERGEVIAGGREELRDINQAGNLQGSGDRWNATRLPWIQMMFVRAVFRSLNGFTDHMAGKTSYCCIVMFNFKSVKCKITDLSIGSTILQM